MHRQSVAKAAVGCNGGITPQTPSDCQSSLCWSAGECKHNVPLARLNFRKSAEIKHILQSSVYVVQECVSLCQYERSLALENCTAQHREPGFGSAEYSHTETQGGAKVLSFCSVQNTQNF